MSVPFLLEIGTEEIPDWMIEPALANLAALFQELLAAERLPAASIETDGTPRRLVLRIALGDEIHERGRRHAFRHRVIGAGEDARQRGSMGRARQQQQREQHRYPNCHDGPPQSIGVGTYPDSG